MGHATRRQALLPPGRFDPGLPGGDGGFSRCPPRRRRRGSEGEDDTAGGRADFPDAVGGAEATLPRGRRKDRQSIGLLDAAASAARDAPPCRGSAPGTSVHIAVSLKERVPSERGPRGGG